MKAETAIFLVIRFASLCVPPPLPHPLLLPSSILLSLVLQGREGGRDGFRRRGLRCLRCRHLSRHRQEKEGTNSRILFFLLLCLLILNSCDSIPITRLISCLFFDQANRSAKLKQCKLDARREQWLSQGIHPICFVARRLVCGFFWGNEREFSLVTFEDLFISLPWGSFDVFVSKFDFVEISFTICSEEQGLHGDEQGSACCLFSPSCCSF